MKRIFVILTVFLFAGTANAIVVGEKKCEVSKIEYTKCVAGYYLGYDNGTLKCNRCPLNTTSNGDEKVKTADGLENWGGESVCYVNNRNAEFADETGVFTIVGTGCRISEE